jgi:hypothetical protein
MDRQDQNLQHQISDLEAELERLFSLPNVPIGKRGELMEQLRSLKLRAAHPRPQ